MEDCGVGFSAIAGSTSSHQKFNRYANIMPCKPFTLKYMKLNSNLIPLVHYLIDDVNRVILMPIEGNADCQGDYINASYIDVRSNQTV